MQKTIFEFQDSRDSRDNPIVQRSAVLIILAPIRVDVTMWANCNPVYCLYSYSYWSTVTALNLSLRWSMDETINHSSSPWTLLDLTSISQGWKDLSTIKSAPYNSKEFCRWSMNSVAPRSTTRISSFQTNDKRRMRWDDNWQMTCETTWPKM